MPLEAATAPHHRFDQFSEHLATALRELHVTEHAGALSGVMAECCLAYLGPMERAFLAAATVQACDAEFQACIVEALSLDEIRRGWGRQEWERHEWQRQKCVQAERASAK